jgi:hypothetical protein
VVHFDRVGHVPDRVDHVGDECRLTEHAHELDRP